MLEMAQLRGEEEKEAVSQSRGGARVCVQEWLSGWLP